MNFFNFFKSPKSSQNELRELEPENVTPVTEDSQLEKQNKSRALIKPVNTGYPIDLLYVYLKKDYETIGYNDAFDEPTAEYCNAKVELILNEFQLTINQVLLRYRMDIRHCEKEIKTAMQLFAIETSERFEEMKAIMEDHISEVNVIQSKLQDKTSEILIMIESYKRGFRKGYAELMKSASNPLPRTQFFSEISFDEKQVKSEIA